MAESTKSEEQVSLEAVEASEPAQASDAPEQEVFQMPDGSTETDKEKYSKAWLALGGGLCNLMGDDLKMHSFDPFVAVVWKNKMMIQLPADFVDSLVHKNTQLMWQNHNLRLEIDSLVKEGGGPQDPAIPNISED